MRTGTPTIGAMALAEVETCHAFFCDWYAGRTRGAAALDARLAAFSPDFTRIAPDGRIVRFADLSRFLGERRSEETETGFAIRIEDGRVIWENPSAALVSYIEHQIAGDQTSRRLSTAFFLAKAEAPMGVVWRHLQETLIDPPESGGHSRPN